MITLLLGAGLVHAVGTPRDCTPLTAHGVTQDKAWTDKFAAYGNDNSRNDDWTGADGTWSVRLPGGRTLWIFADTFLGPVGSPPNSRGEPFHWRVAPWTPLIRNSALLEQADGRVMTLRGTKPDGSPGSWITRPGDPSGVYWPMSAVVEPRRPGSAEMVLRVFVVRVADPSGEHVFGVLTRGGVATFSLDDLRAPVGFKDLPPPPAPNRLWDNQIFYGSQAIVSEDHIYIYGGTGNTLADGQSAYLVRAPLGASGQPDTWEFWAGREPGGGDLWSPHDDHAKAIVPWTGIGAGHTGVSAGYSVAKVDGTYLLFTMDTTVFAGGIWRIASYWGCSPSGPWHGPSAVYDPPEIRKSRTTYAYFPIAHPELSGDGSLLLSYDVNDEIVEVSRNVSLYRPRFVRIRLQ